MDNLSSSRTATGSAPQRHTWLLIDWTGTGQSKDAWAAELVEQYYALGLSQTEARRVLQAVYADLGAVLDAIDPHALAAVPIPEQVSMLLPRFDITRLAATLASTRHRRRVRWRCWCWNLSCTHIRCFSQNPCHVLGHVFDRVGIERQLQSVLIYIKRVARWRNDAQLYLVRKVVSLLILKNEEVGMSKQQRTEMQKGGGNGRLNLCTT